MYVCLFMLFYYLDTSILLKTWYKCVFQRSIYKLISVIFFYPGIYLPVRTVELFCSKCIIVCAGDTILYNSDPLFTSGLPWFVILRHEIAASFWPGIGQFLMTIILPYPFGNSTFRTYSMLMSQFQCRNTATQILLHNLLLETSGILTEHAVGPYQPIFSKFFISRQPVPYGTEGDIIVLLELVKRHTIILVFLYQL